MKKLHKKCEGKGRAKTHSFDEKVQVCLIDMAGMTHLHGGSHCNLNLIDNHCIYTSVVRTEIVTEKSPDCA